MNFCRTFSIRQQLLLWAVALAATIVQVDAGKISVQWGLSSDAGVTGYRLRIAQAQTGATSFVDVGNTNATVVDLLTEGQTYNIVVTAYNRDGIESDPSNQVAYTVPAFSGPTYALQFGKFTHGTATYSPHGTMTSKGDVFPAATVVTLTATPANGYICSAWMINSAMRNGNPVTVTMNQNTVVTPVIKKRNGGGGTSPADPTQMSIQIAGSGGNLNVSVGAEMGAWILEGTSNFTDWSQVASGLTSEDVPVPLAHGYSYFRVRAAQLSPF